MLDYKGKTDYHKKTTKGFKAVKAQLTEGINDPGKLKAIFLAGGPGSGKDYVMNATLAGEGLKEINSDVAFEYLMTKNGLDLEMPDEERVERDIVRGRAKNITKEQERLALAGRLGIIINGTADDLEKISRIKKGLEDDGYETMMVFVNTSNDVSRERNVERGKMGKRKVPDGTNKQGVPDNSPNIRQEKWDLAQKNIGELQKIFGNEKFVVVDNTADIRKVSPEEKAKVLTNFNRVRRMAQQFVRSDNRNPEAQKWIEAEAKKRGITYQEPKRYKSLTQIRTEVPKVVHKPDNALMLQARRLGLSYYGFGRFGRKVGGVNKVMYHSKGGQLVRVQTLNEDLRKWFKEKWVRFDTKGNIKGDCAREPGEGKPKCRPLASARSMSKEDRAKSARRKREEDSVANRSGKGNKPIMVKTESVQKAIDKINRDRMTEEILLEKNKPTNPTLWSKAKSLAKSKFDVYPSAYANGWASKWYKSKGGGWESVNEEKDTCWDGYERKGMKKKGNRMVPNCVPVEEGHEVVHQTKMRKGANRPKMKIKRKLAENINADFSTFMEEHGAGNFGTDKLRRNYEKTTPGQTVKKKVLTKEDELPLKMGYGLPIVDSGLGPETTQYRQMAAIGFGSGLSVSESIMSWVNNKRTQEKFIAKYGKLAEEKLIETALMLEEAGCGTTISEAKSIKKLKETFPSAPYKSTYGDMSPLSNQNKDDEQLNERGADSKGLYRSTESGAGLTRKGAKHFGIKTAVTTPPSKLNPKGKAAKRRKSFCARMGGMPGPMKDEKGRPTRKAMSLRRWNCEE
jgi:dephospho-CoA kinase/SHS2 domain-containing protein